MDLLMIMNIAYNSSVRSYCSKLYDEGRIVSGPE